jgi:hypothetical protein
MEKERFIPHERAVSLPFSSKSPISQRTIGGGGGKPLPMEVSFIFGKRFSRLLDKGM